MKYFSLLLTLNLMFATNWIDLGSSEPEKYRRTLLSSIDDNIQDEFSMSGYYQTQVDTEQGQAYIIDAGKGSSILKEGFPDLDKITASIVIPNEANMNYKIISTEYTDIENIIVAPSKGNMSRQINPSTVPYSWNNT